MSVTFLDDRDPRLWWAAYAVTCSRCLHEWAAVLCRPAGSKAPAVARDLDCPACRGPFGVGDVAP